MKIRALPEPVELTISIRFFFSTALFFPPLFLDFNSTSIHFAYCAYVTCFVPQIREQCCAILWTVRANTKHTWKHWQLGISSYIAIGFTIKLSKSSWRWLFLVKVRCVLSGFQTHRTRARTSLCQRLPARLCPCLSMYLRVPVWVWVQTPVALVIHPGSQGSQLLLPDAWEAARVEWQQQLLSPIWLLIRELSPLSDTRHSPLSKQWFRLVKH